MNKCFNVWLCGLVLGVVLIAPVRGLGIPDDWMPLADVRTGMIGEAHTVVTGFKIEKLKVEILGVEMGALPGSALILARLEGPGVDTHGIVAGMSGSPVFIDGKLIGAVAYGWRAASTPIAGITPIESMLTLWDDLDEQPERFRKRLRQRRTGAGGRFGSPVDTRALGGWDWMPEWEAYQSNHFAGPASQPLSLNPRSSGVIDAVGDGPIRMEPLGTPLYMSGVSDSMVSRLEPFVASRGLRLFAAGGAVGSNEHPAVASPPMRAGSGIAIPIMTGDVTATMIGTVVYCDGKKLLAFGHPMFGAGEGLVDLPMAHANMLGIVQSYQRSFKIGEAREVIGTIQQDRTFAIGGVIGDPPARVQLTATVRGADSIQPRSYHFSIWEDQDWLPTMAATALAESFGASASNSADITADCSYTIHLADGRDIKKKLRTTSPKGSFFPASFPFMLSLQRDLFLLLSNPFMQVDIDSIDVEMSVERGFNIDTLLKIAPRYSRLLPGDTLELDAVWRPYQGRDYSRRMSFALPANIDPGTYVVHVADSSAARRIDQRHVPAHFRAYTIEETIDMVRRMDYLENTLRIYLFEPGAGLSLGPDSMEGLPSSIQGLIAGSAPGEMLSSVTGRLIAMKEIEFEYPLSARSSFTVEVVSRLTR